MSCFAETMEFAVRITVSVKVFWSGEIHRCHKLKYVALNMPSLKSVVLFSMHKGN